MTGTHLTVVIVALLMAAAAMVASIAAYAPPRPCPQPTNQRAAP